MPNVKKYLSIAFVFLIQGLKFLNEKLTGNAHNPNPNAFDDLTPVRTADNDHIYSNSLVWALENPNIRNIALTGPYGSGKSSILKTFESKHPEYRYLNISLASFDEESAGDDADRKRIEISILQQIFYRVSGRQMPDSRFKRIKATKGRILFFQALWLLLCLIAGVFLFKPAFFNRLSWWAAFAKTYNNYLIYLSGAIFLLGIALVLTRILRNYNSARFHKLNLSSGEIELAAEADTSILNKHLDEILYFFEKTGYNVVALEDLDRFKDPEKIFSKLRELNNIINNSRQINHKVTFIYALMDDVFTDDKRTKFFDFFIPVIPVINSSNSGELLLKKFQAAAKQGELTDNFLMNITFFIEDMRQLKNVYNEYIIYKTKLKLNLTEEKLFSMILYKNFYPTDFAELNANKGMVYRSFKNKQTVIRKVTDEVYDKITKAKVTISELENIHLSNLEELRGIYLFVLAKALPDAYRFQVGSTGYNIGQLSDPNVFEALKNERNIQTLKVSYNSWQNSGVSFKTIENTVNSQQSFDERKKQIELKFNQETEKLKSQISHWQNDIDNADRFTLAELMDKFPKLAILPEVEKERIVLYLLRSGYIDETYQSYISHFYEGTITRTDMEFVFSIKNRTALSPEYQLVKIDQLIKKLEPKEFQQHQVLNYQLIDFLAEKNATYKQEFSSVVKQLSDGQPSSVKFIDEYLKISKMSAVFVKALCKQWPSIWDLMNNSSDFTQERLRDYLKLIILHADIGDFKILNKSGRLKTSIEGLDDLLTIFSNSDNDEKIKKMLKELSVEFQALQFVESRKDLFDFTYHQSYYRINNTMIDTILTHYATNKSKEFDLSRANYSSIRSSGCEQLNNYIQTNIDLYINDILFAIPENIAEEEAYFLELLNNADISDEDKESLIEKNETAISDISSIDPLLWDAVLEHVRLLPTWKNISLRFEVTSAIDDILLDFLNTVIVYEVLGKSKMASSGPDVKINELLSNAILKENRLSDSAYKNLISGIPWTWNSLDMEKTSPSKVDILLNVKKINMTVSNYKELKEYFNGKNIKLVENDFASYKKLSDKIIFDEDDYRLLYSSVILTGIQKKYLVNAMDPAVISTNATGSLVSEIAVKQKMLPLSFSLLMKLVAYNSSIKAKVTLLNNHLASLDKGQLTLLLKTLGGNFAKITERNKHPSLPETPENWHLANYLNNTNYVSSIKPVKEQIVLHTWSK